MRIRIDATDLPGLNCSQAPGFPGYTDIHVAVQGKAGAPDIGRISADSATASWNLECQLVADSLPVNVRGPQIQGRPQERFIYLTWDGILHGHRTRFRRAKLQLNEVTSEVWAAALKSELLIGRVGLTDGRGHPLCASVRPPAIDWSAG